MKLGYLGRMLYLHQMARMARKARRPYAFGRSTTHRLTDSIASMRSCCGHVLRFFGENHLKWLLSDSDRDPASLSSPCRPSKANAGKTEETVQSAVGPRRRPAHKTQSALARQSCADLGLPGQPCIDPHPAPSPQDDGHGGRDQRGVRRARHARAQRHHGAPPLRSAHAPLAAGRAAATSRRTPAQPP